MHYPHTSPPPHDSACCLHLVAAAGRDVVDACLAQVAPGDTVVFLDAGVLHVLQPPVSPASAAGAMLFADADLRAHGLLEAARDAQAGVIDDAGICALLVQCRHCLTWR